MRRSLSRSRDRGAAFSFSFFALSFAFSWLLALCTSSIVRFVSSRLSCYVWRLLKTLCLATSAPNVCDFNLMTKLSFPSFTVPRSDSDWTLSLGRH
ncbi:hypothetical protein FB451DRAFT_1276064 [Mycena latifolia]|nr:hypothetical protein FB451DRAFT_1276064 [Mycena latifolia]